MCWSDWNARKKTVAAALFCLSGTALFFRGPLFFPKLYHIPYDLMEYHQPLSEFIASSLRETGQLPWWNPYSYMGEPFYGNVQAAMFYPFTLVTVVLGNLFAGRVTLWLLELQLAIHVALAGIGMFVLLRSLRVGFFPALAGATIYNLGAFFGSQTQHLGAITEAAWLPWFWAALLRLEARRDWPSAALAGLAFALMILPGFPAVYIPTLIFVPLVYGLWMWQRNPRLEWQGHWRALLLLAAALLLGMLLSAVSWLPGYHISKQSIAAQRPAIQALKGLPLEAATSLFWPNLLNQLRGIPWLQQNTTFLHIYQGVPALLLVLAGLRGLIHSLRARTFLAAMIVAALWMFGTTFFLAHVIYWLFPGPVQRAIYPGFVLAYFSLFFAGLAALSLDAWERGERSAPFSPKLCLRLALLALMIALLLLSAGGFAPSESAPAARAAAAGTMLLLVALILGLSGFLVSMLERPDAATRKRFSAALCVVILLDLAAIGSHSNLNTYESEGDVPPPAVAFLRARLGPAAYRIDTSEAGYTWQTKPPQWRLPSANGMNPFLLRDSVAFLAAFSHLADRQFVLDSPESPLLDLAGIRYIVTERDKMKGANLVYNAEVNIFENPRAFPRFFLVGAAIGIDGVSEALHQINMRHVDPARTVLVPAADVGHFSDIASPSASQDLGKVELLRYTPNEWCVRITANRPAALVNTETYTRDWHATLDDHPLPLVRADGVFRAVPVPAGTHVIRMFIMPHMLYAGVVVSSSGVLVTVCCFIYPLVRKRRGESVM